MTNTLRYILVLTLLIGLSACSSGAKERKVCFDDKCIRAEVAQTEEERGRGLQNRTSLGNDEGMLFIFPSSRRQGFWMKDTLIPLDMIWMDAHKKIVFIMPGVLPCENEHCSVYTPDKDAKYVLEVNAGVSVEMGLKVGDQATF